MVFLRLRLADDAGGVGGGAGDDGWAEGLHRRFLLDRAHTTVSGEVHQPIQLDENLGLGVVGDELSNVPGQAPLERADRNPPVVLLHTAKNRQVVAVSPDEDDVLELGPGEQVMENVESYSSMSALLLSTRESTNRGRMPAIWSWRWAMIGSFSKSP